MKSVYTKKVRQSLKTKKWEKFRDKMMRKSDYLCQESLRYGLSVSAEMVHHIFPVSEYPELEFVEWNCLALTNRKHNTFHDRVNDKVVGQGIYWQKKRKKEFQKFYGYPPTFGNILERPGNR
ncbi:TPA: HNH endonuclease [Streptococcus suis]|nr:HNH endonuclease [Streptococcus suis]